jgi:large subunit ribosomal protein L4
MKNLETKVYGSNGKELRSITLPETIFGLKWNADMMHQVITGMQSNQRAGTAHTKGRGDVRGGGKKPWRQKGTGRARHGSNRSPIWIGGGTTHGPNKDKDFSKKINKKTRVKALFMALSEKFRKGTMLFVDTFSNEGKTKDISLALKGLEKAPGFATLTTRKSNNVLVLSGTPDAMTKRAFKNIPFATYDPASSANALDVMRYRYVVVAQPDEALQVWSAKGVARSASKAEVKEKKAKAPKAEKAPKEKAKKPGRAKKVAAEKAS